MAAQCRLLHRPPAGLLGRSFRNFLPRTTCTSPVTCGLSKSWDCGWHRVWRNHYYGKRHRSEPASSRPVCRMGAWPIGVSGTITLFIALLAYLKRADITITRTDWLLFISALSSLPLWCFTSDPLWAVVILTTVDALGFGPTFRKAYRSPHSESLLFFSLFVVRNILVIFALEHYSMTTVLFPAIVAVACMSFVAMVSYRRRVLAT